MKTGLALIYRWSNNARWALPLVISFFAANCKNQNNSERPTLVELIGQDLSAPKGNHAYLIIDGGRKFFLDSVANGIIPVDNPVVQVKKIEDGVISLSVTKKAGIYIFNPVGSKVLEIKFGDSNRIWLNAGTSLIINLNSLVKAEISGEAYFEIRSKKAGQFELNTDDSSARINQITATDAGFNVNCYQDEPDMRVTLIKGEVSILNTRNKELHLKSDDQAVCRNGLIHIVKSADTAEAVAWKKGIFYFDHNGIAEILRQYARWYDVEIRFPGGIPDRQYLLTQDRNISLFTALSALKSKEMHISLEGRIVKVE